MLIVETSVWRRAKTSVSSALNASLKDGRSVKKGPVLSLHSTDSIACAIASSTRPRWSAAKAMIMCDTCSVCDRGWSSV